LTDQNRQLFKPCKHRAAHLLVRIEVTSSAIAKCRAWVLTNTPAMPTIAVSPQSARRATAKLAVSESRANAWRGSHEQMPMISAFFHEAAPVVGAEWLGRLTLSCRRESPLHAEI